jgi:hypothetical protein
MQYSLHSTSNLAEFQRPRTIGPIFGEGGFSRNGEPWAEFDGSTLEKGISRVYYFINRLNNLAIRRA